MSIWMEGLNELQHYSDLRREAEQHRLARNTQAGHQETRDVFYSVMNWLTSRLSAYGNRLQKWYETAAVATTIKGVYL